MHAVSLVSLVERISRMNQPVFKFENKSYCIIFCAANSDVVQMTSNIATKELAEKMRREMAQSGCHVFHCVPAGILIAALHLVKEVPQ
jgi:hypothetical protein